MSQRGRRPTTNQIRAQNERRTSPYPKQNNPSPRKTHMGQDTRIKGDDSSKTGMFGPSQGAGAPPAGPNGPISRGLPPTDVPKAVYKVLGRFNVPKRRFAPSMWEWGISQVPSSPPIKGGPLPLIPTTHKRRRAPRRARATPPQWA
jgi:hypothetical protein